MRTFLSGLSRNILSMIIVIQGLPDIMIQNCHHHQKLQHWVLLVHHFPPMWLLMNCSLSFVIVISSVVAISSWPRMEVSIVLMFSVAPLHMFLNLKTAVCEYKHTVRWKVWMCYIFVSTHLESFCWSLLKLKPRAKKIFLGNIHNKPIVLLNTYCKLELSTTCTCFHLLKHTQLSYLDH